MGKTDKALKITGYVLAAAVVMVATIFGAIWVSHIESDKAAGSQPKCVGQHAAREVKIEADKVVPAHTDARRCDTLTITNLDDKERYIAFGPHDRHITYDGVSERYVTYKGFLKITLVQTGTFRLHDHIEQQVAGTFTVR